MFGIEFNSKCHLCGSSSPTVFHILNGCPVAYTHGGMTVFSGNLIWLFVSIFPTESICMFSDLPELRAHDNPQATVPHNLVITTARPDMVYGDTVALLEPC